MANLPSPELSPETPFLAAGRGHLDRGAWREAAQALEQALLADQDNPEILEYLASAYWWLDSQDRVIETRERAFRLYRERGDLLSAARIGTNVGFDHADYRGDIAVASGWFQRAASLLVGLPPAFEHGWLALYQGFIALMFHNDIAAAWSDQKTGAEIAHQVGSLDLEMLSVALAGLILIREGNIEAGMRQMDEAMTAAIGGEMSDLVAIGNTCCSLIYACEAVADYERADQWCRQTREFCRRTGLNTFFAICRNYYASVLIWKGAWDEAEAELTAAMQELETSRPSYAKESLAKLGELRRRQGRLADAEAMLQKAEPHMLSLLGRAALALDRGRPDDALDFLERFLRRIGIEDQAERAFALALSVRARLAKDDLAGATELQAELQSLAASVGTAPLLATAHASRGLIAFAQADTAAAKRHFEDAIDLFGASDGEFEASTVRLDFARTLEAMGRKTAAHEQAMLALSAFRRLGASFYADRAGELVVRYAANVSDRLSELRPKYGLSPRETEILSLIATGKTNQDIAAELVLSIRTVERHISTIYEKLNLSGRAARAAAAAIAIRNDPTA